MQKIGEIAKLVGINVKTLRYYEEMGLIKPALIDDTTGYRYYDDKNTEKLKQILYLKDLGFSLKQIKNLSEDVIHEKKQDLKRQKDHIEECLRDSFFYKEKGEFIMEKTFENDEKVVGKWKLVACYKSQENMKAGLEEKNENGIVLNCDSVVLQNIYFLPNGEGYWIINGWTKGILYTYWITETRAYSYELDNEKLILHIPDYHDNSKEMIAVYKQIDHKKYTKKDIAQVDDTSKFTFVEDKDLIGIWKVVDFIADPSNFEPSDAEFKAQERWMIDMIFKPNGETVRSVRDDKLDVRFHWTKGWIYKNNTCAGNSLSELSVAGAYFIKQFGTKSYLFWEWKSGDYVYGHLKPHYYVFVKEY